MELHRIRTGARAVLAGGIAVSVLANILVAQPSPVARFLAALAPVALAVSLELLSRVPVRKTVSGVVRLVATAGVGAIAGWMSYFHMVELARRNGEANAHLLPLAVDGMILVASITLLELGRAAREAEERAELERQEAARRAQELEDARRRDEELARDLEAREAELEAQRAAQAAADALHAEWLTMTPKAQALEIARLAPSLSNRKIANHVGVSDVTVGAWRREAGLVSPSASRRQS
jgi:hypothetical protein